MSHRISRFGALIAAAAWAFALVPATAAELLVKLHDPSTAEARQLVLANRSLGPGVATGSPGWHRFRTADADSGATAAALRRDARVAAVLEPRREQLAMAPNDTLYASEQWWLGSLADGSAALADLPAAWNRSTGRPATPSTPVIAVLDSGYTDHPELDSRWLGTGHDFVSSVDYANDADGRDTDARDPGDRLSAVDIAANRLLWDGCEARERSTWHGTLMAGQIAALSNNGRGVAGVHWALQGRLLPVRVAGKCGAAVGDVVDGLLWAAGLDVAGVPRNTNPARVIVLGVAGFEPCDTAHPDANVAAAAQLYIDALAVVRAQGALVVAAAGNQRGVVGRPASCPGAFAVTALNRQGFKALYANYGPQVALATVGGDGPAGRDCDTQLADSGLASTANDGTGAAGQAGYAAGSGTSFAAPVVGGVAALMWTVNPALTLDQLEQGLRDSARPHVEVPLLQTCTAGGNAGRCQCTSSICGAGILDADQALAFAGDPAAYQAPVRSAPVLDTPAIRACAQSLGLPVPPDPPASQPGSGGGGGGGGASGPGWLLGLLLALLALRAPARAHSNFQRRSTTP